MQKNNTLNELKTSSFDRKMSMAKTSLNIGRRWASSSLGSIFADKTTREARKHEFMSEQSKYLVSEIGKLKGSVVKIGQMMALYGEHLLPAEITEALHSLNDNTAVLSWQVIQKVLREELGDKLNDLVVQSLPIGTASLAQVHRAIIKETGQQVVLKVQYPGVADAIDSDLSMFTNLLKISNAVPQTRAFDSWVEEIRDLLHREVNYTLEAETTKVFADRLSDDERFIVPSIVDEYCTPKLICMSYESGLQITDEKLQELSQERRNAIGQSALEIIFGEIFTWGEMQTDPNFGNYLIRLADDGVDVGGKNIDQLILLDFGAIRRFDGDLLTIARALISAGFNNDKEAMLAAINTSGFDFLSNMSDIVRSDMADVFLLATEPFRDIDHNGLTNNQNNNACHNKVPDYCLDSDGRYIWADSNLHSRLMALSKSAIQSVEFSIPPKEFMFISRKFIGAYTLLTVLNARTKSQDIKKYLL